MLDNILLNFCRGVRDPEGACDVELIEEVLEEAAMVIFEDVRRRFC